VPYNIDDDYAVGSFHHKAVLLTEAIIHITGDLIMVR
jgi:hypothetical protein